MNVDVRAVDKRPAGGPADGQDMKLKIPRQLWNASNRNNPNPAQAGPSDPQLPIREYDLLYKLNNSNSGLSFAQSLLNCPKVCDSMLDLCLKIKEAQKQVDVKALGDYSDGGTPKIVALVNGEPSSTSRSAENWRRCCA